MQIKKKLAEGNKQNVACGGALFRLIFTRIHNEGLVFSIFMVIYWQSTEVEPDQ
jgi:hypothetical protein